MFSKPVQRLISLALVCVLVVLGCDRYIDSEDPATKLPAVPPTPINLGAVVDSTSVTLSWEVIDTTAVRRFRIYTTDSLTNQTRLRDSTTGVTFSRHLTGLRLNQAYAFQVATVGAGGNEGFRSEALVVRMQVMSISIDNNAEYTRDRSVAVQLTAPTGTTNVMLSEDQGFAGATWLTYAPSRTFALSAGDGTKWIYAKYLLAGGVETGYPMGDSIILDSRAFSDSVYFEPHAGPVDRGSVIHFYVKAQETGGEAAALFPGDSIRLFDDGTNGDATPNDALYSYRYIVPYNLSANNVQVSGSFVDAAGNRAPRVYASYRLSILDDPPEAVTLAGTAAAGDSVRLSWSVSAENDFQEYRIYRQQGAGTVDETDQRIAIINTRATAQFTDIVTGAGTWLYRIYVVDENLQTAGSNTVTVVK